MIGDHSWCHGCDAPEELCPCGAGSAAPAVALGDSELAARGLLPPDHAPDADAEDMYPEDADRSARAPSWNELKIRGEFVPDPRRYAVDDAPAALGQLPDDPEAGAVPMIRSGGGPAAASIADAGQWAKVLRGDGLDILSILMDQMQQLPLDTPADRLYGHLMMARYMMLRLDETDMSGLLHAAAAHVNGKRWHHVEDPELGCFRLLGAWAWGSLCPSGSAGGGPAAEFPNPAAARRLMSQAEALGLIRWVGKHGSAAARRQCECDAPIWSPLARDCLMAACAKW